MDKRITWSDIYKDFQQRYPRLSKIAVHYQPSDYLTILITFSDGLKMAYDYARSRGRYVVSA